MKTLNKRAKRKMHNDASNNHTLDEDGFNLQGGD